MATKRVETRPDFFVEIERGFLAEDDPLIGCALDDFSNLQILPDGRAYRCGLLVDKEDMASLTMNGDQLRLTRPGSGEELLRSSTPPQCNACPAMEADGRRACIYDKVSSIPSSYVLPPSYFRPFVALHPALCDLPTPFDRPTID